MKNGNVYTMSELIQHNKGFSEWKWGYTGASIQQNIENAPTLLKYTKIINNRVPNSKKKGFVEW